MSLNENITFRRVRTQSDSNPKKSYNDSETDIDVTACSMPDISDDEEDQIKVLKNKLETQALQLISAHNEIEALTLEISDLKRVNNELMIKNDLLKKITNSPAKQKHTTPKKTSLSQKKNKQTQTEKNRTISEDATPQLHTETQTASQPEVNITKSCPNTIAQPQTYHTKPLEPYRSNKMCILSMNKYNRVLSIAEEMINKQFDLCHYLNTDGNISSLLNGIDSKLSDFTVDDFCVIFIGENDFIVSKNYAKLVLDIRNTLSQIVHTNIVICLPTYKYNSHCNMYNWRVRSFNNLLYQDVITHKYAFVLDSNSNISYDYNTFYRHSGQLNNFGFRTIFVDLLSLVTSISMHDNKMNTNSNLKILTEHKPTNNIVMNNWLFR